VPKNPKTKNKFFWFFFIYFNSKWKNMAIIPYCPKICAFVFDDTLCVGFF